MNLREGLFAAMVFATEMERNKLQKAMVKSTFKSNFPLYIRLNMETMIIWTKKLWSY